MTMATHQRLAAVAVVLVTTTLAAADLPVMTVWPGNPKGKGQECVSWWPGSLLGTNTNTTILTGQCKLAAPSRAVLLKIGRSTDAGRSWTAPVTAPYLGQTVYSRRTSTIFMTAGDAHHQGSSSAAAQLALHETEDVGDEAVASPCAVALNKYCLPERYKGETCLVCEKQHETKLVTARCTGSKLSRFRICSNTSAHPPSPHLHPASKVDPYKTSWAHELPQLSAASLAKCETTMVKSTDDGQTFSAPAVMNVNNSLGPHYTGGGLNHGIEIQHGPHAGRLAMARRFDCPAAMGDHGQPAYFHSLVLFSDDQGEHCAFQTSNQLRLPVSLPASHHAMGAGTVGQLLPQGWTECQIAEMSNGSLLMTSRMYGEPYINDTKHADNSRAMERGFARSDDGGERQQRNAL